MMRSNRNVVAIAAVVLGAGIMGALPFAVQAQQASAPTVVSPAAETGAARLGHFHDLLGITPAQEPLWANVVSVIRQNARERRGEWLALQQQHPDVMTRLEALHDQVLPAREKSIERFITAFKPLYESFSPEQKRAADALSAILFHRA